MDYRVVALGFLSFVALGLPGGMIGVAWPSMRDTFNVPSSALGTLLLLTTIGVLVTSFFNGPIVSRIGIGWAMVLANLLAVVTTLGYALAESWWLIVAISLLRGISMGVVDAGMNLYFANHFSPRLMNWLHASFGLGAALGPLLMTTLLFQMGVSWRWGYVVMTLVMVVMTAGFFVTLKRWRTDSTLVEDDQLEAPPIFNTLRQPAVVVGIFLFVAFTGIESVAGNWSFTLLNESRSIDEFIAGQWASFYWWSFTLGRIVFGTFANRLPTMTAIRVCIALTVIGTVLFSFTTVPVLGLLALLLIGFGNAPVFPLLITITPARMGVRHATNAIGFQVAAANLGFAALPALAGFMAERSAMGFEIVVPMLIVLSLMTLILFQVLDRMTAPKTVKMPVLR